MDGLAMFMSFCSLLMHPTGQQYDIQQLEGREGLAERSIWCTHQLQIWHQPVTIQKAENVITGLSIINHAITSKLKSLTTYLLFRVNITAQYHFFSIKTDKVTWKTKKTPKNGKNRLNNFQKCVDVMKLCCDTIFIFSNNRVLVWLTTVEKLAKIK